MYRFFFFTIIVDVLENIWNFGIAMKQSENRI